MTVEVRQMLQQAESSRDADAMLRAGAAALRGGAHAEAVTAVRNVLRDHPGHPQLWQLLGLLHRNLDELGPAVEAFAQAAELAPDDAMIAHGRACVCYEAGLPASRLFERARHFAPSDRPMLLRHAAAQIAEGASEAAMAAIDQELRRDPAWLEGHSALARLRWTRGERETFADSFERALVGTPREVALWRGYVETLLKAELYEQALAVLERARATAGPQRGFDVAEAIARSELGEMEGAGELFRRAAPIREVPTLVHYLRYLLRTGQAKQAAAIAERAAPADPSHQIWPYLSVAWRLLGDARWEWLEGDPRFVGIYDLRASLPPLDALADRLRVLHRTVHQPLEQSVRGGTQTEGHLFARVEPEIRQLRQAVVEAVEGHVAQLPPPQASHPVLVPHRAPPSFAGAWSVRLSGGGRHIAHVHPAGWFSSALYVALPSAAERGTGEAGWLELGAPGWLGFDLPPIRTIEPRHGRLVLFPSTMWHGTRPFDAGERLSVAFDVKRPG